MKQKLFGNCTEGRDKKFYNLCISSHDKHKKIREFCEKLWLNFKPYADKSFLTEIRNDFTARFWEMYLCNAFLEKGIYPKITNFSKGPDLLFVNDKTKIWVEAVSSQNGENANKVEQVFYNRTQIVPEDKIMLRLLSVLSDKVKKYNGYINDKIVSPSDVCIIALNGSRVNLNDNPINIFKSLFPLGDLYIDNNGIEVEFKNEISKNKDTVVEKFFSSNKNKHISAILYSNAYATDNDKEIGFDFYLILNPNATNPLPENFYLWDVVMESNVLKNIHWQ